MKKLALLLALTMTVSSSLTAPLEQQIHELEAEFEQESPEMRAELKARLNELYAQQPENQRFGPAEAPGKSMRLRFQMKAVRINVGINQGKEV